MLFVYLIIGSTLRVLICCCTFDMFDCCIISIGRLTSLVDSSVNLVMSLVSHGSLYIHLIHLILLLILCVDMNDILVLCMTASHLHDYTLHVYVGHTCMPLSPNL